MNTAALTKFPTDRRLKRRRLIGALFARSSEVHTKTHGAVRIVYRLADRESSGSPSPYQIAFSVPRRVKRAVDRNRLKRLMRVAFQQCSPTLDRLAIPDNRSLSIMVLFRGDGRSVEKSTISDTEMALAKVVSDVESWHRPDAPSDASNP